MVLNTFQLATAVTTFGTNLFEGFNEFSIDANRCEDARIDKILDRFGIT